MERERVVPSDVDLALRDTGGAGPAVLLLHGAGRSLADWYAVEAAAAGRYRFVSMDLRCHGRSGDAPWSWDAVLDDVRAVLESTDAPVVAAVGHSLGGLVAVRAAGAGLVPVAVDLDGFGGTGWEQHAGLDAGTAARGFDALVAFRTALLEQLAVGLPLAVLEEAHAAMAAEAQAAGLPALPPDVVTRPWEVVDATATPRPPLAHDLRMRRLLDELDLPGLLRSAAGRIVVVRATAGAEDAGAPDEVRAYAAAMATGVRLLLQRMEAEGALVLVELDADHSLHVTHAREVLDALELAVSGAAGR